MQSWRSTPKSWWKDWQNLQKFWVISKDQNISSSIKIKKLKEKNQWYNRLQRNMLWRDLMWSYVILCDVLSQLRHLHIVQLNHYIERHPDDSQHFCKKIEIMFQTENAKWRHVKNKFWECSNRFYLFSNQIHWILSWEEENCFRKWTPISEARSYVWTMGYSIYKTYQRPKNKLKYCGWYRVIYCLTKV